MTWNVSNGAQDEDGNLVASKMKPEDWARIASAAGRLKKAAQYLTQARSVVVAPADDQTDSEGTLGAWGGQGSAAGHRHESGDVSGPRAAVARRRGEMLAAGSARNATKLGQVSGTLDQLCEQCHVTFWVSEPERPALDQTALARIIPGCPDDQVLAPRFVQNSAGRERKDSNAIPSAPTRNLR